MLAEHCKPCALLESVLDSLIAACNTYSALLIELCHRLDQDLRRVRVIPPPLFPTKRKFATIQVIRTMTYSHILKYQKEWLLTPDFLKYKMEDKRTIILLSVKLNSTAW